MYVAAVLTPESKRTLLNSIQGRIPEGWETIAHHSTIRMGKAVPEDYVGDSAWMLVTHYAINERVLAVKLYTDFATINKVPHITIAVNRAIGAKPVESNGLENWIPVPEQIELMGIIQQC